MYYILRCVQGTIVRSYFSQEQSKLFLSINEVMLLTFRYTLTNGVTRSEVGLLTTAPDGTLSITVKGTWSQPFENELFYEIEFSADEKGFRPRLILQKGLRRNVKG